MISTLINNAFIGSCLKVRSYLYSWRKENMFSFPLSVPFCRRLVKWVIKLHSVSLLQQCLLCLFPRKSSTATRFKALRNNKKEMHFPVLTHCSCVKCLFVCQISCKNIIKTVNISIFFYPKTILYDSSCSLWYLLILCPLEKLILSFKFLRPVWIYIFRIYEQIRPVLSQLCVFPVNT